MAKKTYSFLAEFLAGMGPLNKIGSVVSTWVPTGQGGSGGVNYDVGAQLTPGKMILACVINLATAPTAQTAIWLCYKDAGGTILVRTILASDAPGNNNGSLTINGNAVISASQGGQGSAGTIVLLRLN